MNIDGPPKPKGECGHCGSPRLRRQYRANANDGSIPVWEFRCFDCKGKTLGALVMLPPGSTTLGALDEDVRNRQKRYSRNKFGYTGETHRGTQYLTSDRLNITVQIVKGRRLGVGEQRTIIKHATPELRLAAQRQSRREYMRRRREAEAA
jgi:hypothetical protein